MCEVGKCCLCISLYHGCLISAMVTVAVSITQTAIFSLILIAAHNSTSYTSGDEEDDAPATFNETFTVDNETESSDTSTYSFTSTLCPFGFEPLLVSNKTVKPLKVEPSPESSNEVLNVSTPLNASMVNGTKVAKCVAPGQMMLLCMVFTSSLYGLIGVILYYGVKNGISQLLSIWFFYTVGYNILALVVGLLDGVYTGAADISSYVVCLITVYCIVVVDSYYEKILIGTEEGAGGNTGQNSFSQQPSLVVVKSSPQSELDPNASSVMLLQHNGHAVHDDLGVDNTGDGGITEPFLGPKCSVRPLHP